MNMTCIAGQRRIFLKILFGLVKSRIWWFIYDSMEKKF